VQQNFCESGTIDLYRIFITLFETKFRILRHLNLTEMLAVIESPLEMTAKGGKFSRLIQVLQKRHWGTIPALRSNLRQDGSCSDGNLSKRTMAFRLASHGTGVGDDGSPTISKHNPGYPPKGGVLGSAKVGLAKNGCLVWA
jgi:hypothetical protein